MCLMSISNFMKILYIYIYSINVNCISRYFEPSNVWLSRLMYVVCMMCVGLNFYADLWASQLEFCRVASCTDWSYLILSLSLQANAIVEPWNRLPPSLSKALSSHYSWQPTHQIWCYTSSTIDSIECMEKLH